LILEHQQSVGLSDGNYDPTILASVLEYAHSYDLLSSWFVQNWGQPGWSGFREPHQFKITKNKKLF